MYSFKLVLSMACQSSSRSGFLQERLETWSRGLLDENPESGFVEIPSSSTQRTTKKPRKPHQKWPEEFKMRDESRVLTAATQLG